MGIIINPFLPIYDKFQVDETKSEVDGGIGWGWYWPVCTWEIQETRRNVPRQNQENEGICSQQETQEAREKTWWNEWRIRKKIWKIKFLVNDNEIIIQLLTTALSKKNIRKISECTKNLFGMSVISKLMNWLDELFNEIINFFKNLWNWIKAKIQDIATK